MHTDSIITAAAPASAPPSSCLGLCCTCRQPIFDDQRVCLKEGRVFCMDCASAARPAYVADSIGVHGAFWACLLVGFFGLVALFAVCFR
jgi:hypothetical protein